MNRGKSPPEFLPRRHAPSESKKLTGDSHLFLLCLVSHKGRDCGVRRGGDLHASNLYPGILATDAASLCLTQYSQRNLS